MRIDQQYIIFKRILILFAIIIYVHANSLAQEIDNTSSYKNISGDGYIRVYMENDFFTGTDDQYTEGTEIEISFPWVKKFPLTKLLVHPKYSNIKYGVGLEQAGYTPYFLFNIFKQYFDRPFASTLFLKTFQIATDTIKKQRFATTLCTGVIGKIALGEFFQDVVHNALNYVEPPDWKYQIRNDVILNYQVDYQKQLFSYHNNLILDAASMARAGTLSDKASTGIDLIIGSFQSPYSGNKPPTSKWHIYVYDNPEIDVVGYDATMEGGIFNHSSPYIIPAADITRVTFMNRIGFVAIYKSIRLEYNEVYLTKQFSSGSVHRWGGIDLVIMVR